MRRRRALIGLLLAFTLVPTTTALALDDTPDADAETTDVTVEGRGKLVARGVGEIVLAGGGWARVAMRGDAVITDHAGDAEIVITRDGVSANDSATTVVLDDFRGVIWISGSDFTIEAEGRFRRIAAKGEGTAFLQGRGWYRATGGSGVWTPVGLRVTYDLD